MSELTIQEHADSLYSRACDDTFWYVIAYDPRYGHARTQVYRTEQEARDKVDDLKAEGRRPRLFVQSIVIEVAECKV